MARKKSKAPLAAQAAAAVPAARSPQVLAGWIISPFWDSILFIGAPLVVIAGFLPLRSVMSSERIAILLLAFFTFGHHFPTFLRSYGDTELFRRFRWRFLLAPPILFCAAMWFNSRDLHGLMLFVAAWDIWHVLMQHYGFMRIYDSKAGAINALTSNLDWAFAISWYVTLIATSPHYSYNLLDRAYASGLPVIDPATVAGTRYGLQVLTALLTLAYIGYHLNLWRLGRPVSLKKLSLMGIFLAATFYLYVVIDDFLVGFTIWSAFHCIQYYGIVWVFNRGRVERQSPVTSFVRFLFRPRWSLAILYTGLIFAYGSFNLLPNLVGSELLSRVLMALIFTSNALHYYYDGFIWKMRDPETREFLDIASAEETGRDAFTAAWARVRRVAMRVQPSRHGLLQASYLGGAVVLLAVLELSDVRSNLIVSESLAAAAPDVGIAHYNLGNALWKEGKLDRAIAAYGRALERIPESSKVYNNLGAVLAEKGDYEAAMERFEQALELRRNDMSPSEATSRSPLLPGSAHSTAARMSLIHDHYGDALSRSRKPARALDHYREALKYEPYSAKIQASIGATLGDLGQYEDGVKELRKAVALDPAYATAHMNLASLLAYLGDSGQARRHYKLAFQNGDARVRQAAQAAMGQLPSSP